LRVRTDEFALRVTKAEDLPERLRPVYLEALKNGCCRHAVYAPPHMMLPSRHHQPVSGYLLMNFDERLLVTIDRAEQPVERVSLPLADLICVEIGEVLLFSWMKLVFGCNETQSIKIPFNTVRADLFIFSLNLIRDAVDVPLTEGGDLVPVIPELDFKFNNVLHGWLRRKEVLLGFAFQPEVLTRRFLVFERQVMPPLLATLTDRQFLTITEEPPAAWEKLGRFTQIYTYSPHLKIKSLAVETLDQTGGFAELHLTLANRTARFSIRSRLSAELAPQFARFCGLANDFIAKNGSMNKHVLVST
jgi:hypothetical protein